MSVLNHSNVQRMAAVERAAFVGNESLRPFLREEAERLSKAVCDARVAMNGFSLGVVEEVLTEQSFYVVNHYVATFIPTHADDDDLAEAFENIARNSYLDKSLEIDAEFFARLDKAIASFKAERMNAWGIQTPEIAKKS